MTSPEKPERPFPTETAAEGPWRGPVYSYRGAEIRCNKGGHVCALLMPGHPLDGATFGVPGTVTPLVDVWLDEGRLPSSLSELTRKLLISLTCTFLQNPIKSKV